MSDYIILKSQEEITKKLNEGYILYGQPFKCSKIEEPSLYSIGGVRNITTTYQHCQVLIKIIKDLK